MILNLDTFTVDSDSSLIKNAEEPNIYLIEGDNLAVLNFLVPTLRGKVDVIYIDPPYNTGSSGFAYKDKFSHSEWLSFMGPRLEMARDVLSKKGVIFISIDDKEQARLRILCDDVFGEENFIAQLVWHKTKRGKALSRVCRQVTEYVICYSKNKKVLSKFGLYGEDTGKNIPNPLSHRPNKTGTLTFPCGVIETNWEDGVYLCGLYGDPDDSLSIEVLKPFKVKNGVITSELSVKGKFRWTQDTLNDEIKSGEVSFKLKKGKFRLVFFREIGHKAPSSLLNERCGVGTYEEGSKELKNIIGSRENFVYPKPVSLMYYLIKSAVKDNPKAIVMDFFAGSGGTGQAVAQINKDLGGERECVLITSNEGKVGGKFLEDAGEVGICKNVTRTRLISILTGAWVSGNKDPLPGNLHYLNILDPQAPLT